MWALVKDGKIEELYRFPKSIMLNNVRYPSNMFTKYTKEEKIAIGIYEVESGTQGDNKFQNTSQPSYTFDSTNKIVKTSYTLSDKKLTDTNNVDGDGNAINDYKGNQTVALGLKSQAIRHAKVTAHSKIQSLNWLVERYIYDNSKTIPDVVKTYVAAIRTDCADIISAINGASDMAAFKALYTDEFNEDGSIKTINRIHRWTDDYEIKKYYR
jgi:hypothetical protein